MELPELRVAFPDRAALARELADNLALGRAFVAQSLEVPVLSECVLVLIHPESAAELRLRAQVVMLAAPGVGLALTGFDAATQQRLRDFVSTDAPPSAADTAPDQAATSQPAPHTEATQLDGDADATLELNQVSEVNQANQANQANQEASEHDAPIASSRPPSSELQVDDRQRRLRQLNAAQQIKLARTGELADRIALERLYGKQVWDALLHNPKLSLPEVARIARKGTVPKPLLELILENAAWIKADPVRRALLGNPKLGPEAVLKLLRATPKPELKLIEKGTAYGAAVRESARKLLRQ